jgi:hypothetical protein
MMTRDDGVGALGTTEGERRRPGSGVGLWIAQGRKEQKRDRSSPGEPIRLRTPALQHTPLSCFRDPDFPYLRT